MRPRTLLTSLSIISILSLPVFTQEAVVSSTTALSLDDCLKTANELYEPLKLARQEIEVSTAKVTESRRSLYPTLVAKGDHTEGAAEVTTGSPSFTEDSYGVQATYPIYQGGRLSSVLGQSKLNLSISNLKYEKTKKELTYSVAEAYWNLSRLICDAKEYEKSLVELKKIYGMAKKLFDNGSINERELLSVQSQLNQAEYQLETNRSDVESQRWKLSAAMGMDKLIDLAPAAEIPFSRTEISLEDCLSIAQTSNYDVRIAEAMTQVERFGVVVKKSYKKPKIDFNGFYGRSGGAFQGETLNLTEDYQVGVQIAQPIDLNTFNLSGQAIKTSPKLGQTTLTESDTLSASISLLDAYKQKSEEKEASLTFNQALFNLKKAKIDAAAQVREAYFNYRKALSQVNNAELDHQLAKKELAIDSINLGNSKANFVNIAEDTNKLASSAASLNDAKAFYIISIAAINKAIGQLSN